MKNRDDLQEYFNEFIHYPDLIIYFAYSIFMVTKIIEYRGYPDDLGPSNNVNEHCMVIMSTVIFMCFIIKYLHLIKIYEDYGLQTVLIGKVITDMVPFMMIFILWNVLFAYQLQILKSNDNKVGRIKGVPQYIGYWIVAFQNGIMGDI